MDTVEQPGRAIGAISRDIARDEGGRAEEEAWAASCRRHTEARRAENQSEWHLYHLDAADRLRATLSALVAHHEREAERLQATDERKTA